jgi:hypothetical protein
MMNEIMAIVIAVFLGGVITPLVLNVICDKMGWLK